MGVNYTSGGHAVKIDHARGRAVMSAVYLADNKHMVEKQMTAEKEDHNVPSANTSYSNSRSSWLLAGRKRKVIET